MTNCFIKLASDYNENECPCQDYTDLHMNMVLHFPHIFEGHFGYVNYSKMYHKGIMNLVKQIQAHLNLES